MVPRERVMHYIESFNDLERLGRVRLSKHFQMRQFLHSEIAAYFRLPNIPIDPGLAIENGRRLCETILEPIMETFGPIIVRSGYRSPSLNEFGAKRRLKCARNEKNAAYHVWDLLDDQGHRGAAACITVPWLVDHGPWAETSSQMAWWVHDHLPYHRLTFFTSPGTLNIGFHEKPIREIFTYLRPKRWLVRESWLDGYGYYSHEYAGFPVIARNQPRQAAVSAPRCTTQS